MIFFAVQFIKKNVIQKSKLVEGGLGNAPGVCKTCVCIRHEYCYISCFRKCNYSGI